MGPHGPTKRNNPRPYSERGFQKKSRQRPTFPGKSIIGPGRLDGRVRNGNGYGPAGMATWKNLVVKSAGRPGLYGNNSIVEKRTSAISDSFSFGVPPQ